MPAAAPRHLPNLDLLRSVAITMVVANHVALVSGYPRLGPFDAIWIGNVGVYLFFVHTALVLMQSLERQPDTAAFYIRRIFRIYPLATLATLLAVLTRAPVGVDHMPAAGAAAAAWFMRTPLTAPTIAGNLLLIQNLFGGTAVVGVLWSLAIEMQMYLLLPSLFFTIARQRRRWPLLLLWLLAALFSRSVFPSDAVNLVSAAPLFLAGAIAYLGFLQNRPRLPSWLFLPALLALLAIFLRHPSLHLGWLLALTLGLGLPLFRQIDARPAVVGSQRLAQYSYGIYLSHPFAMAVGFGTLAGRPFALQLAVTLAITAAAAVAAYHLLEKPFIDLGARLANRTLAPRT